MCECVKGCGGAKRKRPTQLSLSVVLSKVLWTRAAHIKGHADKAGDVRSGKGVCVCLCVSEGGVGEASCDSCLS